MRISIRSVVVVIFFSSCNPIQKKHTDEVLITEAEVKDFIRQYDAMWASRDTGLMKQAMDNQYIYFTSTGSTIGRADIISRFSPADKYKVEKAERSEVSVQLNGNTAIVSSRWIGNGSFGNERFNDDQRCGLVIQKSDGKLKLLTEHCTQITGRNGGE